MIYKLSVVLPEELNNAVQELRIELNDRVYVTAGEPNDANNVYMVFDRDCFKSFLKKAIELIELEENGEA